MGGFRITKLRNLGGKLGEQIVSTFNTESVTDLLDVPLATMRSKLGHDTGLWAYNTIRGIDTSEVNSRTQIKSMLSAKSFRPTINSQEQAIRWLRIFVADIFARLVEEGVLENKRRPRTINLHHRHEGQVRSRQGPIPQGKVIDATCLLELAKDLLGQIVAEGRVWPCANLSLSVGGFEDGVKGNMGIDAFLVRGEEAEALRSGTPESRPASTGPEHTAKKRCVEDTGIQRFFSKRPTTDGSRPRESIASTSHPKNDGAASEHHHKTAGETDMLICQSDTADAGFPSTSDFTSTEADHGYQLPIDFLVCSRCNATFGDPDALQSHQDWHMAKDLQEAERVKPAFVERQPAPRTPSQKSQGTSSRRGRGGKLEPGQSRLRFG
ncbi:hypothetical protein ACJZ2D_009897 [Fusarium nematophilum]